MHAKRIIHFYIKLCWCYSKSWNISDSIKLTRLPLCKNDDYKSWNIPWYHYSSLPALDIGLGIKLVLMECIQYLPHRLMCLASEGPEHQKIIHVNKTKSNQHAFREALKDQEWPVCSWLKSGAIFSCFQWNHRVSWNAGADCQEKWFAGLIWQTLIFNIKFVQLIILPHWMLARRGWGEGCSIMVFELLCCLGSRLACHYWWNYKFWIVPVNSTGDCQGICLWTEA